ncbi:MAG: hypothetical protein P1V36_04890 [Planctomycetota bacterium]|nr:hypothetical protein [Planctomycetota bacterium]
MLTRLMHEGLRLKTIDESLGTSLHVSRRSDFANPDLESIIRIFESGVVPRAQRDAGWDFAPAAWIDFECPPSAPLHGA